MHVVILGAKGYIGQQFLSLYPEASTPSVDIADARAVADLLDRERPDLLINTAGKTGRPNVDWCEEHRMETIHSNVTGPLVLLEECAKRGIYWVHMSSGCIFEGDNGGRGFGEADAPNFTGSFYARSKIWSDQVLAGTAEEGGGVLILRIRMPFDDSMHERSLITKLSKYARVLDVENSLTYLPDALLAAQTLIERRRTGIVHLVNPGAMSPYLIMQLYREIVDPAHAIERLTIEHLSDVVRAGRSNCILRSDRLSEEEIPMRSVEDAARAALSSIARANAQGKATK